MLLKVKNIIKSFRGIKALDDVSLHISPGEIVGLIGPNGAGKTTLFNIITGVYKPDKGEVYFNGKQITGLRPYKICKMGIARTFQLVKPISSLTVLENVAVASIFGKSEEKTWSLLDAENEALKTLEYVGLLSKKDLYPSELTVAEQKKMELARALATNPKLLLLDELLAGLNLTEMDEMLNKLKELHESKKLTIVIVEHVMHAVMNISQRIIVLHYGRKIAEGTPDEVASNEKVIEAYLGEKFKI